MIGFDFNLPFDDAVQFFRDKVPMKPDQYRRLEADAKAKAFTIAGTSRMDVIGDMYGAIDKAISKGTTFQEFKKDVKGIMATRGWEGINPHRLDTIFRTNIQQAYQAGHYQRQKELVKERPYWRYVAVMDGRVRPAHAAMNGTILPADDPFWQTSYPPNGFRCRCTVVSLSQAEFEREGGKLTRDAQPIADPGFDHAPGATFDKNGAAPGTIVPGQRTWKDYGRDDLRAAPAEKRLKAPMLEQKAANTDEAVRTVMKALGLSETNKVRVVATPVEEVAIDADLLPHMVEKRTEAREQYANYIIPTLTDPYEIWLTRYRDGWRRQYIGLFEEKNDLACVVRINRDGSLLWNIMQTEDRRMNNHRVGIPVWKK